MRSNTTKKAPSRRFGFLFGAAAAALAGAGIAEAQQTTPPAAPEAAEEDDIVVVTGSRIPRAGIDTLQPAIVINDELLKERAFVNVADALNQLPAFGVPGAGNVDDQDSSNVGQNFVNFFGLGSQRTLTLVNGRRFVSSNPPNLFGDAGAGLQVDLNTIPVGLVDRIETVAVGGAPIYGADAIAGTVNVILKRDFEGVEATLQTGVAQEGDFETYRGQILAGTNFADDRGNIVLSMEYTKEEGALQNEREQTRRSGSFQPSAACAASGFGRCYITDVKIHSITQGGIPAALDSLAAFDPITNASGQPVAFAPDGTLQPFNFGQLFGAVFSQGGDGLNLADIESLKAPLERTLVNGLVTYQLTPDIRLFGESFFANSRAQEQSNQPIYNTLLFAPGTSSNIRFGVDNPFLSAQARGILQANGLTEFWLARASRDLVTGARESNEVNVYRLVGGADGAFNLADRDFTWDVSYNYGRSRGDSRGFDIDDENFFNALDAVVDPGTGQIVCRVTLNPPPNPPGTGTVDGGGVDGSVAGCAPLNLFGNGAPSQAAINFVSRETTAAAVLEQRVLSANLGGGLIDLPGGEVKFALGYEYRDESGSFQVDGFSRSGRGRGAAIEGLRGEFSSSEMFGEILIPLVSEEMNVPFLYSASIEGAYRDIDNSRAGRDEVFTYGGRLRPIEDIEFRANFTRSVRSPAIVELFLPLSTTFEFANDPCDSSLFQENATRAANCTTALAALGLNPATFQSNVINASAQGRSGGNQNLQNEIAESYTAGAILRPRFLPGFTLAADYVVIELANAIELAALTNVMEGCYDSTGFPNAFCGQFTRNAQGQISDFTTGFANLGYQDFAGTTIDASYVFDLADVPLAPFKNAGTDLGSLELSATAFYLSELNVSLSGSDLNIEKGELDDPEWRAQYNARYNRGDLNVALNARYLGEGAFNVEAAPNARNVSGVEDYWLFNGAVGYDFNPALRAQISVNNLFDVEPPAFANADASLFTNYDLIGRYFTFSLNARF